MNRFFVDLDYAYALSVLSGLRADEQLLLLSSGRCGAYVWAAREKRGQIGPWVSWNLRSHHTKILKAAGLGADMLFNAGNISCIRVPGRVSHFGRQSTAYQSFVVLNQSTVLIAYDRGNSVFDPDSKSPNYIFTVKLTVNID